MMSSIDLRLRRYSTYATSTEAEFTVYYTLYLLHNVYDLLWLVLAGTIEEHTCIWSEKCFEVWCSNWLEHTDSLLLLMLANVLHLHYSK